VADFLAELLELMPHELSAQPGITDAKGTFTPSGAVVAIPCQIEGENKLIADQLGREVTSTRVVYTGEFIGLTIDDWRFDLPAGFPKPRAELKALAIDPASDEDGLLYEIVRFP
jgi:hypothetical protein